MMIIRCVAISSLLWVTGCKPEVSGASLPSGVEDARPLPAEPAADQVEAGRLIVQTKCVSCHAVRGGDVSRNAAAPPLRTLAERYPVTGLPEAFAQGVLLGHPSMPDFRFSAEQIAEILAYLESIQTRQGA